MQSSICYNETVTDEFEKKEEPLALRLPASLKNRLIAIAYEQDRPVGYVARELMLRGLQLFEQDGKLRGEPPKKGIPGTTLKLPNEAKHKKAG